MKVERIYEYVCLIIVLKKNKEIKSYEGLSN